MVKNISVIDYLEARGLTRDLATISFSGIDAHFGLLRLESGWLDSTYWQTFTDDKFTFLDFSAVYAPWKYTQFLEPSFDARLDAVSDEMLENVFILGGSTNYWHFMMDFLPRLIFLKMKPELSQLPLVIDAALTDRQLSILALALARMGIEERPRLLPVPGGQIFRIKNAFGTGRVIRNIAVRIWERFLSPNIERTGPERIFVLRENVRYRNLINQAQVSEMLKGHGFVSIDPGRLPFIEQAQLFSNARLVVGVHGAALTNLLFSPSGGQLIELRVGPIQPFYRDLAAAKGFEFRALDGSSASGKTSQHDDFSVDIDQLAEILRTFTRN